jgi:hypothetical protein
VAGNALVDVWGASLLSNTRLLPWAAVNAILSLALTHTVLFVWLVVCALQLSDTNAFGNEIGVINLQRQFPFTVDCEPGSGIRHTLYRALTERWVRLSIKEPRSKACVQIVTDSAANYPDGHSGGRTLRCCGCGQLIFGGKKQFATYLAMPAVLRPRKQPRPPRLGDMVGPNSFGGFLPGKFTPLRLSPGAAPSVPSALSGGHVDVMWTSALQTQHPAAARTMTCPALSKLRSWLLCI